PFCQPIAPHIPIRERLSSRARCSSVGGDNDQDVYDLPTSYLNGRRQRRMTLLQSLRYQNKQLADSGFELLPEEKSNKDGESITESPIKSRSDLLPSPPIRYGGSKTNSLSLTKIKAKAHAFFGKRSRKKRHSVALGESSSKECASDTEHTGYTSIDYSTKENRQRKSPSTNDSGRGSQGRLGIDEEQLSDSHETHKVGKTIAVIENLDTKKRGSNSVGTNSLLRSVSCPELGTHLLYCESLNERASSARNDKHLETDSDEEFTSSSDNFQHNAHNHDHPVLSPLHSEKSIETVGATQGSDVRFAKKMIRQSESFAESVPSRKQSQYSANIENLQQNPSSTWERCAIESFLSSLSPLPPPMPAFSSIVGHNRSSVRSETTVDDATSTDTSSLLDKMTLGGNDEDCGSYRGDYDTDNDANSSSILLDQYLPILSGNC
ncbi:unnamed protein product, partial [Enterobius vermicularis]|uniref:Pecanex-like protein n=1 Tax=Enterobius vermicularis TaxID=51028 RepID=A0A0N4VK70_ENTVE